MRTPAVIVCSVAICASVSCATVYMPVAGYGIRALDDRELVERGHYLVYGPAHCVACHGDPAREDEMRHGSEIPLSGGRSFDVGPLGTIVAPNITSDVVAGIGGLSDDTLVRGLRYGISRHGKPLVPFMSFGDMTDRDLQAVLSFLRTLPPVAQPARSSELSWLGVIGVNLMLDPQTSVVSPASDLTPTRTAEYGRYLAQAVANCRGCHTLRSKLTGAFIGPDFAGGMLLEESAGTFMVPNLTPIAAGIMYERTEQEFIQRFRVNGRNPTGSPMPWAAFSRMTDTDLGAIYQYLKTLQPAATPRG